MALSVLSGQLAIAIARSGNRKIGDASTTYAAQPSCPSSCPFYAGGGCYAENGSTYTSVTRHLNGAAALAGATPLEVALAEADAIDALPVRGQPLRLHTVGDCKTDDAAATVAAAAARFVARGGGPVWTYTHAWRTVARDSWGPVSVLASCETPEQVELARAAGYATALVVEQFGDDRLYTHDGRETNGRDARAIPDADRRAGRASAADREGARGDRRRPALDQERHRGGRHGDPDAPGLASAVARSPRQARSDAAVGVDRAPDDGRRRRGAPGRLSVGGGGTRASSPLALLPCPQMTRGVACSDCGLCMNDSLIRRRGYSIGFEIHGTNFTVRQAALALRNPADPERRTTSRVRIPAYLAEHPHATNAEIGRALGIEQTSVGEMRRRLAQEAA